MQITWRMSPNLKSEMVFFALRGRKKKKKHTHTQTHKWCMIPMFLKTNQNFFTSLSVIKLEPLAVDGIRYGKLVHATKAIIPASMSFLHNIWAFPIRRKLGRGHYVSSYIIYYSKNELAFNEDLFVHILLIHVAHFVVGIAVSFRVQCCAFHPLFLSSPATPQHTYSHIFQALGPVMCKLLAPSTPSVRCFRCHIPKKMAKRQWPF